MLSAYKGILKMMYKVKTSNAENFQGYSFSTHYYYR